MAEEIELLEVQDIPVEEGAAIDADNAEDVVIDLSLLSSMEEKLVSTYLTKSSPFTICRVPANIRECDHAAYNPRIVSIGPFHRGRENLHAMEKHKWRYLHKVLPSGKGRNNLEKFLKKMKEIETEARNCYSENIQMSSNEFVEMMVLDGCFIIFLFLHKFDFVDTDNEWMSRLIHLDMILLENQLPFFVLECLWELIGQPRDALTKAALLASFECFSSYRPKPKSPEEHLIHHLLHLLHLSFQPDSLSESKHESPPRIPSATQLQEAGVRFQLKQARSFFQVRFEQGLMEMPCLWIYNDTHIPFRNLMAFEQCFPKWGDHFTTYCLFIDSLVHTPRDVSLLRNAGIIRTSLESDKEVALLFNKLGEEIVWNSNRNYLADLFKEVNLHTHKRWPRWRAKMEHDFFSGPTKLIKFTSAVAILVLTYIQTYFSVSAYFRPPMS